MVARTSASGTKEFSQTTRNAAGARRVSPPQPCMSGSDEEIRDDSETVSAPEITVTTDLDSHLDFSSVPRRRRPATAQRDRARAIEGRRTRSSPEAGLVWPVPREAIPRRRRPATTERDPARAADGERTSRFRC